MPKRWRLADEQEARLFQRRLSRRPEPLVAPVQDAYADMLAFQCSLAGLPAFEREHVFAAPRKWRFDLALPPLLFAVEVDGAVHRIKERFNRDLEKHQAAFLARWSVFRVSPAQVKSGEALHLVEQALRAYSACLP